MLAKCSNPSCCAPFRYLTGGRLYLLESDRALATCKSDRLEYFWLCGHCSSTMTLHLGQGTAVVAVPLPPPVRSVPGEVGPNSEERKMGLFLHSMGFPARSLPDRRARLRGARTFAERDEATKWRQRTSLQDPTGDVVPSAM